MSKQIHRMAIAAAGAALVALAPAAYAATSTVTATAETIDRKPAGTNDADDPSFWVHPSDPSKSLVIGTVKEAGVDVYRTDGSLVQTVPIPSGSRYNNIEVLYGINLGGTTRDLAVLSDRGTDKLHIFAINGASTSAPLSEVTASSAATRVRGHQEDQLQDHLRSRGLAQPRDRQG